LQEDPNWIKDKINMMLKCYKLLDNLKKYSANELFKFIENGIARSSNLFEFYSRLYAKKEDYNLLVLEKIICDYTNTMQSILKGIEVSSQYSLKTFIPLRVSEDENLLVKAFKITLKDDVKNIKVYNFEGHEVTLIENYDYIILKSYKMSTYVIPFEVIRKHKIDKIEVILKSGESKYFDSFISYLCEKISRIQIN
jgi:hypothetical protein